MPRKPDPLVALRRAKPFDVVLIEWGDAYSHDSWQRPEDLDVEPLPCLTCGFFQTLSATAVSLTTTVNVEGVIAGAWVIPLGWITAARIVSRAPVAARGAA